MMGDRQWPDPRRWEALTQAEAERDAGRSDLARALELLLKAFAGDFTLDNECEYDAVKTVVAALAVAERERDQAREALLRIEHFPFDVRRDPESDLREIKAIAVRAALVEGRPTDVTVRRFGWRLWLRLRGRWHGVP